MNTEVQKAFDYLKNGGIILYPTDTVWGIGCDATNKEAIQKIYALKQRAESKSMIVLVASKEMLNHHVENIPNKAIQLVDEYTKPLTIIYKNPKGIASNIVAQDNTLAIRLVHHDFCEALINLMQLPLVSTSANISGKPTPQSFSEISEEILKGVDYVVNLHQETKNVKPSSILKINDDGEIDTIRA